VGADPGPTDVSKKRIIKLHLSGIPQLENGNGGESLGDGRNAIQRLGTGRNLLLHVGIAIAFSPYEPIAEDDADRHTGLASLSDSRRHPRIQQPEGVTPSIWLSSVNGGWNSGQQQRQD
jgi:hypothetical protein